MNRTNAYRASRPGYLYGTTAPDVSSRPAGDFEVIPGRRRSADVVTLPASVMGIAKVIVAVALVVAMLCCVRVGLSAASVTSSIAAGDLSTKIENARSYGSDLEVQQSRLSNSTHIRVEAASLGMAPPVSTEAVVLPADVVTLDGAGNLSLTGSLKAIANQG
ncbi:MAG: cell division protein FtsL [Slackia sp.]|nr:cell division protein FtsL [Slackia sp.]